VIDLDFREVFDDMVDHPLCPGHLFT